MNFIGPTVAYSILPRLFARLHWHIGIETLEAAKFWKNGLNDQINRK